MKHRKGITLVELLVVFAVITVLISLLIPAVQRVRETAIRLQAQNNMRQMIIALHNFASANQGALRRLAEFDERVFTPHIAILPFMERKPPKWRIEAPKGKVFDSSIPEYLDPADPTTDSFANMRDSAIAKEELSSYPANAFVFTGFPRLNTVTDGTSNTIGFGQH